MGFAAEEEMKSAEYIVEGIMYLLLMVAMLLACGK